MPRTTPDGSSDSFGGQERPELHGILRHAKTANPRRGVTGALCFADGIFIQVLEGGRDTVSALYNRIAADARHTEVVLLAYREIAERHFAGWSMGQVNLSRLNHSILLKYSEKPELDPYSVSGKVSLALLEDLMATAAICGRV